LGPSRFLAMTRKKRTKTYLGEEGKVKNVVNPAVVGEKKNKFSPEPEKKRKRWPFQRRRGG